MFCNWPPAKQFNTNNSILNIISTDNAANDSICESVLDWLYISPIMFPRIMSSKKMVSFVNITKIKSYRLEVEDLDQDELKSRPLESLQCPL